MNKVIIEVAYATLAQQRILELEVDEGCTIAEAIHHSGILTHFPEIDLAKQKVGIFSQSKKLTDKVKAGDRIEIYRPLAVDPKEARRTRANQQKKK